MPYLKKPFSECLLAKLDSWKDEPLSYRPPLNQGFIADDHAVRLGFGEALWAMACQALEIWHMFPEWTQLARVDKQVQQPGQTVALRLLAGESLSHSQAL